MRLRQGCSGMWIAAAVAVVDQISKAIVRWADGSRIVLTGFIPSLWEVPGLFAIRMTHNTGAAFSMLSGSGLLLIVGTALIIAALSGWLVAKPDALPKGARVGMWMIVGGGLGNLYDRAVYGAVTDFIELLFVRFAVFNIADVAIVCGALLVAIALFIDERRKETAHERKN